MIVVGFALVVGKIFYIQTVERDEWLKIAEKQEPVLRPIPATRGNILDCNGALLASSMPQYFVYMDTKAEALRINNGELFKTHIDSLATGLSLVMGEHTPEEYKQLIIKGYNRGNRRLRLCDKRINYLQKRQLEEIELIKMGQYKSGIIFEAQHKRIKPFGSLASRTIGGIYGDGGYGNSGLEMAFEDDLKGEEGLSARQRIGGRTENVTIREAQDGYDIRTTIDANLQDIVEKALRGPLEQFQAEWGCCILMEVHSGEIKAISNLDRADDGNYYEMQNHAVNRVEPGSTFKPIAMMVAIDDGKVNIDDTVTVCKGVWEYLGAKHVDAHQMDTVLTMRQAIAVSSNIAMAKTITKAYGGSAKKFVNRIKRTGLMDSVYCEIPGAQRARIDVPKDTVTLSKMAYGYSVELSPMQIVMFYNAIANNGKMVRPMLVKQIEQDGDVVRKFSTEVVKSSICSESTLEDIRGALHDVVWDNDLGTASVRKWKGHIAGRKAQSDLVHIAGKTGTAQLNIKGYQNRRHRITFVGYFPEEDPQYTCICMINDPQMPNYDAGYDCGRAVRTIAEKTMAYKGCYEIQKDGTLQLTIKE
ncbi:MAG: peptidoglycan D,D-transpeptidase FtsI family protein [Paludibacteraceae bacterium]